MTLFQLGVLIGARLVLLLASVAFLLLAIFSEGTLSAAWLAVAILLFVFWLYLMIRTWMLVRRGPLQATRRMDDDPESK